MGLEKFDLENIKIGVNFKKAHGVFDKRRKWVGLACTAEEIVKDWASIGEGNQVLPIFALDEDGLIYLYSHLINNKNNAVEALTGVLKDIIDGLRERG